MNIITNIFEACSLFLLFESFLVHREKIPNMLCWDYNSHIIAIFV